MKRRGVGDKIRVGRRRREEWELRWSRQRMEGMLMISTLKVFQSSCVPI
jgi:hypothetical protein